MTEPIYRSENSLKHGGRGWILLLFTSLFLGLEIYAIWSGSRYKWDFFFIMLLWYSVYAIRDLIGLRLFPFALFGFFLSLHFAGMFGW